MKLNRIIHQQIVQLKWHLLACLGLLMALPLEDAVLNLWQGNGFYAGQLSLTVPLFVSPFLAALIACANVQADFDDRRYTFWRSKPAGIKSWVLLKYVIGLLAAFAVISLPFLFAFITCKFAEPDEIKRGFFAAVIMVQSVSLLTYSMCFLCNVLIRKTARAWLVGMAMTGFLLIVPFILPLNLKSIEDAFDFLGSRGVFIWSGYCLTGVPSLAAFILSIVAASRDWHLQTNLKGLLWTGAGLIFLLMLLFTRQVANIKVLDEVKMEKSFGSLTHYGDQLLFGDQYVNFENDRIRLTAVPPFSEKTREEFRSQMQAKPSLYPIDKELKNTSFPSNRLYYEKDGNLYAFGLNAYYKEEKVKNENRPGGVGRGHIRSYKKVYLRSFIIQEGWPFSVSAVDLSDCLTEERSQYFGMRVIDDKIIAFVGNQCVSVVIGDDGEMEIVAKNALIKYSSYFVDREKIFKIPLAPTKIISMQERIRFSIDFNYLNDRHPEIFAVGSLIDMCDDEMSFCLISKNDIARYDVIKWDDEYVYCKYRDARPFTFLEQTFGRGIYEWSPYFVKDGMLYVYNKSKLMVLDIRSDRIRKLGHFERLREDYSIQDIEVLDNGDILLSAETEKRILTKSTEANRKYDDYIIRKEYLSLLKNPE